MNFDEDMHSAVRLVHRLIIHDSSIHCINLAKYFAVLIILDDWDKYILRYQSVNIHKYIFELRRVSTNTFKIWFAVAPDIEHIHL